jgi:hypothetical protein
MVSALVLTAAPADAVLCPVLPIELSAWLRTASAATAAAADGLEEVAVAHLPAADGSPRVAEAAGMGADEVCGVNVVVPVVDPSVVVPVALAAPAVVAGPVVVGVPLVVVPSFPLLFVVEVALVVRAVPGVAIVLVVPPVDVAAVEEDDAVVGDGQEDPASPSCSIRSKA